VATDAPWYAVGLRFECQQCSRCCRGEPGYVWINDDDIRRMAGALGLLPDEFMRAYVRRVGSRLSLTELPGGDCVLWGGLERGCLVYDVRPVQCQTFPFWREHLKSRRAWDALARSCPGLNQGRLYTLKDILGRLKKF
jgi:Fe-S-cluster containining protein